MYHVTTDEESDEQIAALPSAALPALAKARVLLEVDPWAGDPYSRHNPEAPLRGLAFGAAGLIVYLILEDQRRVDLVRVLWADM